MKLCFRILVVVAAVVQLGSCGQPDYDPDRPAVLPAQIDQNALHAKCLLERDGRALGDPQRGRRAMGQFGCAACHILPGIAGGNVHVGPPLNGMESRRYIAGVLPNTEENLVRWIMDPQEIDPLTAMPDLGVGAGIARDMAAYLYSSRPSGPAHPACRELPESTRD